MEDLLKLKEGEIEKLKNMKLLLKAKVNDLTKANQEMQNQIKKISSQKPPSNNIDSNGQDEIYKNLKNDYEKLQNQFNEQKDEISQLTAKIESQKKELDVKDTLIDDISVSNEQKGDDNVKSGNVDLIEEIKQLKNGMFKLGQQNFSIEQKMDKLLGNGSKTAMPVNSFESHPPIPKNVPRKNIQVEDQQSPMKAVKLTPVPKKAVNQPTIPAKSKSGLKSPTVSVPPPDTSTYYDPTPEKPKKPKKVASSAPNKHELLTIPKPSGASIVCPHCGEQNFVEQQDRSRIISYVPIQKFGTKYGCKVCRGEWRYQ